MLSNCSPLLNLYTFNDIALSSFQLTGTLKEINFDTGVYFKDSISRYKSEVFVRDFNGYPTTGSACVLGVSVKAITLNTNIHGIQVSGTMFMNSIRFTYILFDT